MIDGCNGCKYRKHAVHNSDMRERTESNGGRY